MEEEVPKHSMHTLVFRSIKRSHDMFLCNHGKLPPRDPEMEQLKKRLKARDMYGPIVEQMKQNKTLVHYKANNKKDFDDMSLQGDEDDKMNEEHYDEKKDFENDSTANHNEEDRDVYDLLDDALDNADNSSNQLAPLQHAPTYEEMYGTRTLSNLQKSTGISKPKWHPPWKLYRVISGHLGWVRCVAVEPANEWFATGAADRIIKIWDLATGKLKLSLTGHVSSVRGLAISNRHPYIFSCGEDKQVKCWDLEYNKVIRHYHGHLSAVYTLSLHPGLDVLVTAGRDATARVWDIRTKANIHTLSGHTNTIACAITQMAEPQVITASHDCTIKLWDIAAGKSIATLTHHRKSVRSVIFHPKYYMFASASPDNIKQWKCPNGVFVQNLFGHNAIVNCLAVNADGVLISGADNGSIYCWDWLTGHNFQRIQAPVQPGSMDNESGIFAATFDQSGSRLLVAEADKTVKIYKEDETATEDTHPVFWKPNVSNLRKY